VDIPPPQVGLVIGYAFLWRDEAEAGRDEGRKDRPCVIVVSTMRVDGRVVATVAPITHTPPRDIEWAIELPAHTKARLGLDEQRSWALATDLNQFVWPGVDLRPTKRGGDAIAYGFLPANMTVALRAKILELARRGSRLTTKRTGSET
jgi:hypothetical protein